MEDEESRLIERDAQILTCLDGQGYQTDKLPRVPATSGQGELIDWEALSLAEEQQVKAITDECESAAHTEG